jgi:hypothetical protein
VCAATIITMLACGSDDKTNEMTGNVSEVGAKAAGSAGAGGSSSAGGSGGDHSGSGYTTDLAKGDFDKCYAQVQAHCTSTEMDTAEKLQIPCKEVEPLSIPLSDGSTYGPKTLKAGPTPRRSSSATTAPSAA